MKKMYVFLVITTTIVSISGAEKERPRAKKEVVQTTTNNIPVVNDIQYFDSGIFALPVWSYTQSANEPIGEQNRELTTVYKPASKIKHDEQKPLLRTNLSQPITEILQELRNQAYEFIYSETENKRLNCRHQGKKLACLINDMNEARSRGINEDMMARFIFNNTSNYPGEKIVNRIDISGFTALFFSLLKRYTLTVQQTKEQLPFHAHHKKSTLKDILKEPSTQQHTTHNIYDVLTTIPAFSHLQYTVRHMLQEYDSEAVDIFITCLYDDAKILRQDHSDGLYENLKNEFCNKAYNAMLQNIEEQDIYTLLQIIDNAKNKKDIKHETGLGHSILRFDPTLPLTVHLDNVFDNSIYNLKNRIALFCTLAKRYNDSRCTKTTPTGNQYRAYRIKQILDIILPDSFISTSLFDDKQYAFAEFRQLIHNTKKLFNATDAEVEEIVNDQYGRKK